MNKPELEPCARCKNPREWHGSYSARKASDPVAPWTRHIYLCAGTRERRGCAGVTILVVYADGRRELIDNAPRLATDFFD